jgi:hypothetical protein
MAGGGADLPLRIVPLVGMASASLNHLCSVLGMRFEPVGYQVMMDEHM